MLLQNGRVSQVRRIPNFRLRSDPSKLAAAALEQFSSASFNDTRVEDVARRLGLSKGAIYMHFASKRALFDRVIEEFCLEGEFKGEDLQKSLEKLLSSPSEPAGLVLRIVLREWPSMPNLCSQYLDAIVSRLAVRHGVKDHEMARRVAQAALAPVTMGILFAASSEEVPAP
jgi:AcrR family transcriptional regulator